MSRNFLKKIAALGFSLFLKNYSKADALSSRSFHWKEFDLRFLKELGLSQKFEKNLVYSPASIKEAFYTTAHFSESSIQKEFKEFFQMEDSQTLSSKGSFLFASKNTLWVKDSKSLSSFAKDEVAQRRVNIKTLNPAQPQLAADKVNRAVEEETHGLIKDVINKEAISKDLFFAIVVNTLYLKAKWLYHFNPAIPRDFHLENGQTKKVPMMFLKKNLPYFASKTFEAVKLSYRDSQVEMLFILPREKKTIEQLMPELLQDLSKSVEAWDSSTEMLLSLPKFKVESSFDKIAEYLESQGLGAKSQSNSLRYFSKLYNPSEKSHLAKVIHKAVMIVDEEGTEAAAVTASMPEGASFKKAPKQIKLNFDKAFLFVLRDPQSQKILFTGYIKDP